MESHYKDTQKSFELAFSVSTNDYKWIMNAVYNDCIDNDQVVNDDYYKKWLRFNMHYPCKVHDKNHIQTVLM